MAHLTLESASRTSGASDTSGAYGAFVASRRWMLYHIHYTDSVASRALHQVIMDVTTDRGLRPMNPYSLEF
ncbi:hypothetical protein Bca101_026712 [Brassica carinata]